MEAKLAALEERIDLLSRFTETLEGQFDSEAERWKRWEEGLSEAVVAIGRRLARFREKVSLPRE
ncbi:MAG: hypothetical protein A3G20_05240 [Acidobacteria bacterium RIFCSPLOWO2_12_FULL_59_11]|nr:MAG: hypothetical protein A3G20_05240 [Acidobacteria bacterium RIFCSPLOWO2_12_FULL_59_11]